MITRFSPLFRFLLTAALSTSALVLYPQKAADSTSCARNLKSAQVLFGKGQIDQVPSYLNDCMSSGFKREEQIAAYKLLIQSFLLEDKLDAADLMMLSFLSRYPEYKLSETDHSSFTGLYNTFDVKQIIQLSFRVGTNLSFLTFVEQNSLSSDPVPAKNKLSAPGIFLSAEAKIALTRKLELNLGAGLSQTSFTNREQFLDYSEIVYKEKQARIEIPATITYNYASIGIITFYGRGGIGTALDISPVATPLQVPTDRNNPETHTGADISRSDSRIFLDLFAQAGAGVKLKTPRGWISLEARSNFGLFNQVKSGGASAEKLRWDYNYKDDDFHMNNLNFNVGYTQIFYKPVKRTQK